MKSYSLVPATVVGGSAVVLSWMQTHEAAAVVAVAGAAVAGLLWLFRIVWAASKDRQAIAGDLIALVVRVDALVVQMDRVFAEISRQATATNQLAVEVAALCHTCAERTRLYDAMLRGTIRGDEKAE